MDKPKYVRPQPRVKDPDRICKFCGKPYIAVAPLQKTCSKECRKIKDRNHQIKFHSENPDAMKKYNEVRKEKDPYVWEKKWRNERSKIIHALGGICCVPHCNVTKEVHLHIDYIPTNIGNGNRHPRHKNWVLDHIEDFRLLCANHHYEVTLNGIIEDTNITQTRSRTRENYERRIRENQIK